jgi:hypothetical protein
LFLCTKNEHAFQSGIPRTRLVLFHLLIGRRNCRGAAAHAEFAVQAGQMGFDRFWGNVQFQRDMMVGFSLSMLSAKTRMQMQVKTTQIEQNGRSKLLATPQA